MAKRGAGRKTTRVVKKPHEFGRFLSDELKMFHEDLVEDLNEIAENSAKELVKLTKATAPKSKNGGDFRKAITYTKARGVYGDVRCTWGAKAPFHRITHLLVNGHAKVGGGRVPGHSFLDDALDQVRPAYEKAVEEAITEWSTKS